MTQSTGFMVIPEALARPNLAFGERLPNLNKPLPLRQRIIAHKATSKRSPLKRH